jgi:ABC-2 type transport system permease protein
MHQLLSVFKKELMLTLRDRVALVWLIVLPVAVIAVASMALSSSFGGGSVQVKVPIVNYDEGEQAQAIISAFESNETLVIETDLGEDEIQMLVKDGDRVAGIVFPADFSARVSQGQSTSFTMYVDENSTSQLPIVQGIVGAVVEKFNSVGLATQTTVQYEIATNGLEVVDRADEIAAQGSEIAQRLMDKPLIAITSQSLRAKDEEGYDPFSQNVPGYAVMFMLFGVMTGAESILQEKEGGTLRRLLTTPLPKWAFLGGKLLHNFVIGLGQLIVIFTIGHFAFGLELGNSIPGLIAVSIAVAFAANAAGMMLSSLIKTRKQLSPVSTLFVITSSALGGSWWPLFIMPVWMQQLSKITVNSWAMQGYTDLLMYDKGFSAVYVPVLGLVVYGAICFSVGLAKFRFKEV